MDRKKMRNFIRTAVGYLIVAALAGVAGWLLCGQIQSKSGSAATPSSPVRESGYNLVNPLLICSSDNATPVDQGAQTVIQNAINTEVGNGTITAASVYYRQFLQGGWALVNGTTTYYPASMNKVPLMIAYYNWMEEGNFSPAKTMYMPVGLDENAQQEVQPNHPLAPGQSYTADEIIDAMIQDSDNNATLVLLSAIDTSTLATVFTDLQVPFLAPGQTPANYMTVGDFAFFFRVLYNGTYISHTDSEKALEILSKTDFNDGLVAGVPAGTTVAHKFGLVSIAPNNTVVTARELHDCGIVYPQGKNPYLLCVMTKSTGSLQGAERAIADISRSVYQYATK
jgi:beta-lactamase class A